MLKIIMAAGAYIAAVVGAGFASGQETVSYFTRYGRVSIFGVIAAALLFGCFAYCVSDGMRRYAASSFDGYIESIVPRAGSAALNSAVKIFMMSVFFAMISGGAVLLNEVCGMPMRYGALAICVLCAVVFVSGNKTVLTVNSVLGVLLCAAVVFSCLYILKWRETETAVYSGKWAVSAFSYAGYNILTSGAVIGGLSLKSKRECALFGAVSAVMMLAMMLCMWTLLSIYSGKIYLGELPMLTLAMRTGNGITVFFSAVLFTAMITTALSAGLGVIPEGRSFCAPVLLCAAGYFASGISFSFIVDVVYRICGYVGNALLIFLIINQIKIDFFRKKEKNKDIMKKYSKNIVKSS